MIFKHEITTAIDGNRFVDERGYVSYINELDFEAIKRFYVVENHSKGYIRAWHGHIHESKILIAIEGAFLVGSVPLTDVRNPSKEVKVSKLVLEMSKPQAYCIPANHANGFMSLTDNAKLLIFSNKTLLESKNDDYRFPYNYWDIWNLENR